MTSQQPNPFDTLGMLSLAIGMLLPNLVGLITKESLNSGLKSFLLADAAGLTAGLTQWRDAVQAHAHLDWRSAVMSGIVTWVMAELSYQYWWKPSGLSDWLQSKMIADPPPDPAGVSVQDILERYRTTAPSNGQTHAQVDQARATQGLPRLYTPNQPAGRDSSNPPPAAITQAVSATDPPADPDDQAALAGGLSG